MFTSITCEQLKAMLADAQSALHNLRTGRQVRVVVDQNGDRVEFTAANQAGLITYINQLTQALTANGCIDCAVGRDMYQGPFGFTF